MSLQLYLASASPRRKALLEQLALRFAVLATEVDELRNHEESAADYVRRLSLEKAKAGVLVAPQPLPVLGADTIVVSCGEVFEKPRNFADSQRMLRALSNRAHQVLTAITFATKNSHLTTLVSTQVYFKSLTDEEILQYWQTGEPQDKAGSYAIQGIGGKFVTRIEGSFHAVVGLPLYETQQLFEQFLILTREK
ncbi:MAG: Maf family protein [Enterovibrio sp.]